MLTTFSEITERIIRDYQPESVILFGSRAEGTAGAESDFDNLIVKETNERPLDRRVAVEKLLADRTIPLDLLVYTPREMRELFGMGSALIDNIIEKGRVVYMRKNTQAWIDDAIEDLEAARLLFQNGRHKAACYHCQQSAEKALKALIIEKGEKPERVHDIMGLSGRVKSLGWSVDFDTDGLVLLNSVYKGRYSTEEGLLPYGMPSAEDVGTALAAAEKVLEKTRGL